MLPVLALVLVCQLPSDAPTVSQAVSAGEAVVATTPQVQLSPLPPLQYGLVSAASTAAFVGSLSAGIWVSVAIITGQFREFGRPDPWATGSALVGGFGTTVLMSQLLVPAATLLGNDGGASAGFQDAWFGGWKRSRWAVAAGAVAGGVYFAGAALEARDFGSGQELLLAGAIGTVAATVVYGVLEITGAIDGYNRNRKTAR